ncbi:winged helix-turn-helix domain-containing protein [Candidatus Woesearchaeota archaeon]|nr:winged helix-turn-helix domain-containing protein [Candidatus Woesearchaeota archaeon]MCF8013866.1 winged helix-turn-helix domain-containing protein [Candidatus Woesearchaeota archaeon]
MKFTKITIIRSTKPQDYDINELLQWFGGSLGLFNMRDKDRSCFRIFIILLRDLKTDSPGLSSDDIAEKTGLSRGTVVHHLNKLMESGIVIVSRNRYVLKVESLADLVDVVREDVNNAFDSLKVIGKRLDGMLGLDGEK